MTPNASKIPLVDVSFQPVACWKEPTKLKRGSIIAVKDRFIVLGEYGHLGSIDINPKKLIVRSMTDDSLLAPRCFTGPALYRGLLYLRNEGTILCLDLRSQ